MKSKINQVIKRLGYYLYCLYYPLSINMDYKRNQDLEKENMKLKKFIREYKK